MGCIHYPQLSLGCYPVADQVLADQAAVGVVYGNVGDTTATMTLSVITGTTATGDVSLTVNGSSVSIGAWTAIGTDAPAFIQPAGTVPHPYNGSSAGSVVTVNLTGLNPFPQANPYSISVLGVEKVTGNIITQAQPRDDVVAFVATCNSMLVSRRGAGTANKAPQEPHATGSFSHIRAFAEKNATVNPGQLDVGALFIIDDVIYADQTYIDDSLGTGHLMSSTDLDPEGTKLAYDYCLAWFNFLGMYEDAKDTLYQGFEQWWGRNEDRLWCLRNLPLFAQRGDHEFTDDYGMVTNTRAGDTGWYANAMEPYNAIIAPCQGATLQEAAGVGTGDPSANHWAVTIGPCRFVSADAVYNGSGDGSSFSCINSVTNILDNATAGQSQIKDLLVGVDVDTPFHTVLWPLQLRRWNDSATGKETSGCSWSYRDMNSTEYDLLILDTGNTEKSIMDNPRLNGTTGQCDFMCGDFHAPAVLHYNKVFGGINTEDFTVFYSGSCTGSANFSTDTFSDGEVRSTEGITIRKLGENWGSISGDKADYGFSCLRVELYGNAAFRKKRVALVQGYDTTHNTQISEYSWEFVESLTGNEGQLQGAVVYENAVADKIPGFDL